MQKILLAIIASAVAVTMLSAFGPLAALATTSPGVGNGAGVSNSSPGSPNVSCGSGNAANTPGNSGSSGGAHTPGHIYAGTGAGNSNPPGQPGGSQYDVSCFQHTSNPGQSK